MAGSVLISSPEKPIPAGANCTALFRCCSHPFEQMSELSLCAGHWRLPYVLCHCKPLIRQFLLYSDITGWYFKCKQAVNLDIINNSCSTQILYWFPSLGKRPILTNLLFGSSLIPTRFSSQNTGYTLDIMVTTSYYCYLPSRLPKGLYLNLI